MQVIRCKDAMFALVASGIALYNVSFFGAFLSIHIENNFNISND